MANRLEWICSYCPACTSHPEYASCGAHGAAALPDASPSAVPAPRPIVTRPIVIASRRRWTAGEVSLLLWHFSFGPYPCDYVRSYLSRMLESHPRAIQIWFQNARARLRARCDECRKAVNYMGARLNAGVYAPTSCPPEGWHADERVIHHHLR
jgi:hypothetical protein